jgi:hypothetical protein
MIPVAKGMNRRIKGALFHRGIEMIMRKTTNLSTGCHGV